jgi:flavin-dependent dehydrogenase
VLGLTRFLTHTQIAKNGLRFWFSNADADSLSRCSEIGGKYLSALPSFLVDRSELDEEVLRCAREAGVTVLRPALVQRVELNLGELQGVHLAVGGGSHVVRARWVIDASGVRCFLARAEGWWKQNAAHPTLSCWSRWKSVRDWDDSRNGFASAEKPDVFSGLRSTATNHLVGDGWWAWWIALRDGDTSIGVVMDQRLGDWPDDGQKVGEKLRSVLSKHPAARHLMEGAVYEQGDVHFRRNLAYCSEVQCGDGFFLVGDASAFLDPLYSPGMDWTTFTTCSAVKTISAWARGEAYQPELERHQRDFLLSYQRSFEALYQDKYEYLGDFELLRPAFLLDISLYYLFVVSPVFKQGKDQLANPPYSHPRATPIFKLMRLYNHRLAGLGRKRKRSGRFGRKNANARFLYGGFNLRITTLLSAVFKGLLYWLLVEIREGLAGAEAPPQATGQEDEHSTEVSRSTT